MTISNKHVTSFISQIVKEEIDKALSKSEKRRKEFKSSFAQVFSEADATVPAPAAPSDPNAPASPGSDATGTTMGSGTNAATGSSTSGSGMPGEGDPNAEAGTEDGEASDMDASATTSGGGFGGFGGGGGGGGGGTDTPDASETEDDTEESEMPEEPQGDPIESMVTTAQDLLSQTNDPNLILKSLKGQIQTVFQEPEHALGLVKALYDTQDSILQAVAQRLYLFIKTAPAK